MDSDKEVFAEIEKKIEILLLRDVLVLENKKISLRNRSNNEGVDYGDDMAEVEVRIQKKREEYNVLKNKLRKINSVKADKAIKGLVYKMRRLEEGRIQDLKDAKEMQDRWYRRLSKK